MRVHGSKWAFGFVYGVVVLAVGLGCSPSEPTASNPATDSTESATKPAVETPSGSVESSDLADDGGSTPEPSVEPKVEPEPPPKPAMPLVVLSEEHKATCVLNVGDTAPVGELPAVDGKPFDLASLRGAPAVLVFWNADNLYGLSALEDIQSATDKLADRGVKAVGVHVGGTSEGMKSALADSAQVKFPQLLDADDAYFSKFASKRTPRVYLLDATGKIVWFDMGYEPLRTHRVLTEALNFLLDSAKPAAS